MEFLEDGVWHSMSILYRNGQESQLHVHLMKFLSMINRKLMLDYQSRGINRLTLRIVLEVDGLISLSINISYLMRFFKQ